MFKLDLIEFPTLQRIDAEDGRRYVTPEGNAYPSVTTVLGKTKDMTGLEEWRQRIGEEEANKELRWAANRGNGLHSLCERFVVNEEIDLRKEMPMPVHLFAQVKPFILDHIDNIKGIEVPLYSDYLKVAGTTDLVAEWDGQLAIIDYKSSKKNKRREWIEDYFIQTAIYAIAWEERTGVPINKLVILMGVEESTRGLKFEATRKEWQDAAVRRIKTYYSQK